MTVSVTIDYWLIAKSLIAWGRLDELRPPCLCLLAFRARPSTLIWTRWFWIHAFSCALPTRRSLLYWAEMKCAACEVEFGDSHIDRLTMNFVHATHLARMSFVHATHSDSCLTTMNFVHATHSGFLFGESDEELCARNSFGFPCGESDDVPCTWFGDVCG